MWSAKVYQGTGGVVEYTTLDQIRKYAPSIMAMKKRGSNEYHKYINIYKGKFDYEKKPMYFIQYDGFMTCNPDRLVMYNSKDGRVNGWIERDKNTGAVYWHTTDGKMKRL